MFDFLLQTQTIELTFSPQVARFLAYLFDFFVFHFCGISIVFMCNILR